MWAWLKRLWYHFRHGWQKFDTQLTRADVANGKVPQVYRDALRDMQTKVGPTVTAFYARPENQSGPFGGKPYLYDEPWERLVQRVVIVDSIPGDQRARGTFEQSTQTLTLTNESMNDIGHLQHELLHAEQKFHEELYGPLGYQTPDSSYPRGKNHWPVIFADLIGD
jgi:hypothetical protein